MKTILTELRDQGYMKAIRTGLRYHQANVLLNAVKFTIDKKLDQEKSISFREEFDATYSGKDISDVWRQFAIWMLVDPEHGVIRFTDFSSRYNGNYPWGNLRAAIQHVAELYIHDCKDEDQWKDAKENNFYACGYTLSVSVTVAAVNAARFAMESARFAAESAWFALRCVIHNEQFERDDDGILINLTWGAVAAAVKSVHKGSCLILSYQTMADKLIELIKQAPEQT